MSHWVDELVEKMRASVPLGELLYLLAFKRPRPAATPTQARADGCRRVFVAHCCCDNPLCLNVRHAAFGGNGTNWLEGLVHTRNAKRSANYFACLPERDGFPRAKVYRKRVAGLKVGG